MGCRNQHNSFTTIIVYLSRQKIVGKNFIYCGIQITGKCICKSKN